jgi:hypothetical protein
MAFSARALSGILLQPCPDSDFLNPASARSFRWTSSNKTLALRTGNLMTKQSGNFFFDQYVFFILPVSAFVTYRSLF